MIIYIGIHLAKSPFTERGVDENEHIALRKSLIHKQLLQLFADQPPALVAMETASGAHHWARGRGGDRPLATMYASSTRAAPRLTLSPAGTHRQK